MTNLTEQWKKGELPSGWYWVEGSRAEGIYAYTAEYLNNMYRPRNSERIVEQVPSYEECQANQKWIKHLEEVIKIYEQKDKQATETSIAYNEIVEENAILKKLLKDCHLAIFDYPPFDLASDKIRLMNKIEEVLK